MDRVSLTAGLSPYCRWTWDSGKFKPLDSLEARDCCKNGCVERSKYCTKIGGSARKCLEALSICESGCDEIPSKEIDLVTECALYYGCDTMDPWCIKKNGVEILDCCRLRGEGVDCDKFIGYLSEEKGGTSVVIPSVLLGSEGGGVSVFLCVFLIVFGVFVLFLFRA